MTIEEAEKLLMEMQSNCNKPTSTDPKRFDKSTALGIAIKLLSYQRPKKVIGRRGWLNNRCPVCNSEVTLQLEYGFNLDADYCPSCGTSLDWSEEE